MDLVEAMQPNVQWLFSLHAIRGLVKLFVDVDVGRPSGFVRTVGTLPSSDLADFHGEVL